MYVCVQNEINQVKYIYKRICALSSCSVMYDLCIRASVDAGCYASTKYNLRCLWSFQRSEHSGTQDCLHLTSIHLQLLFV